MCARRARRGKRRHLKTQFSGLVCSLHLTSRILRISHTRLYSVSSFRWPKFEFKVNRSNDARQGLDFRRDIKHGLAMNFIDRGEMRRKLIKGREVMRWRIWVLCVYSKMTIMSRNIDDKVNKDEK